MTRLYLMKNKSDVAYIFKSLHVMIQTQFSTIIKVLRSDNGGEYVNEVFQGYFQEHGLIHETTCPYTPQQNGVAERKNMQLLEITIACLTGANMRPHFLEEAITNAMDLLDGVPTSVLKFQTPLDKLASSVAIPSQLKLPPRVFGCVLYVHIQNHLRSKLDPCALKCVFVGYHPYQKGYKCHHPSTRNYYVRMDVTFSEHEKFYSTYDTGSPL